MRNGGLFEKLFSTPDDVRDRHRWSGYSTSVARIVHEEGLRACYSGTDHLNTYEQYHLAA